MSDSKWFFAKRNFSWGDMPWSYDGHRIYEVDPSKCPTPDDPAYKHIVECDSYAQAQNVEHLWTNQNSDTESEAAVAGYLRREQENGGVA